MKEGGTRLGASLPSRQPYPIPPATRFHAGIAASCLEAASLLGSSPAAPTILFGNIDQGSPSSRRCTHLFDSRLDVAPNEGPLQLGQALELDMPHRLALALQNAVRIGKRRASWKAEIDMPGVGGDVAEPILHLGAEAKPDGDGVNLVHRFGGVRLFFEDDLAQSQGEIGDGAVIRSEEAEKLRMGRASHIAIL